MRRRHLENCGTRSLGLMGRGGQEKILVRILHAQCPVTRRQPTRYRIFSGSSAWSVRRDTINHHPLEVVQFFGFRSRSKHLPAVVIIRSRVATTCDSLGRSPRSRVYMVGREPRSGGRSRQHMSSLRDFALRIGAIPGTRVPGSRMTPLRGYGPV